MATTTISKNLVKGKAIEQLQIKAAIFDELIMFLEEKYFGYLMNSVEKEQNIPLSKAKMAMQK